MPSPKRSLIQLSTTDFDSSLMSDSEYTAEMDGIHRQKKPCSFPRWCAKSGIS